MEYGKIIAVTGLSGLFELLTSKTDGGIIRSLEDKSTKFVSSRVHNFSHLESIEVFTESDNVNLVEVFLAMKNSQEKLPEAKDAAQLKKYFETVYPGLDFQRVYSSDLKKIVRWFEILEKNGVELKLSSVEEETDAETSEKNEVPAVEAAKDAEVEAGKPKKASSKKSAGENSEGDAATDEKKAAPKKSAKKKSSE